MTFIIVRLCIVIKLPWLFLPEGINIKENFLFEVKPGKSQLFFMTKVWGKINLPDKTHKYAKQLQTKWITCGQISNNCKIWPNGQNFAKSQQSTFFVNKTHLKFCLDFTRATQMLLDHWSKVPSPYLPVRFWLTLLPCICHD